MYTFTIFRKILFFFLVTLTFQLVAQPTITEDYITNMLNQKRRIVLYETNLNISAQLSDIIAATGANQVWDFRDLNYVDSTVTFEEFATVSPSDPFLSNPNLVGSNLIRKLIALPVEGGLPDTTFNYQYGNLENGSWIVKGSISIADLDLDGAVDTFLQWFSPPSLQIQFPVTFNSEWTDSTSLVQNFQGMEFTSSTFIDTTRVTGWGMLHTPTGSGMALRRDVKELTINPFTMMTEVSNDIDFDTPDGVSASIVVEDGRAFYRSITPLDVTTSTKDVFFDKQSFHLNPSSPNPSRNQTMISFTLDQAQKARIRILDLSGRERAFITSAFFQAGLHEIPWQSKKLESGIFILEMRVGNQIQQQKLVLQK